jgi:predicted permease
MLLDLVHLFRHMRRWRVSALTAIVTLALTLGAAASIFVVVDVVLLTPPPFANPTELFNVGELPIDERAGTVPRRVTYPTFNAWRERAGALASFEAFEGTNLTLTGIGAAARLQVTDVTHGFFTLLGVPVAFGRTFTADDIGRPVAIVSHAFWEGTLDADPDVIGRNITLGKQPHTVVGVLPERFSFGGEPAPVWRPLNVTPQQAAGNGLRVFVMARLLRDTSPAQLASALDDVSLRSTPSAHVVVRDVVNAFRGDRTTTLALLAGAAAIAISIAFANLAGLLLVRSIERRRELALRTALGARPAEITRQLLLESGAIVALGAIGGILLAWWMTPVVANLALERVGGAARNDFTINWRVIGALVFVAIVCGCICGWLPAAGARRWNVVDVLRRGATAAPRESRARRAFVAAQVTVAFVLLVSMSLLGRTLLKLLEVNPGFNPNGVVAMQLSLPAAIYRDDDQVRAFYTNLEASLAASLGRGTAAVIDELPLTGSGGRRLVGTLEDQTGREAVVRSAGTGYFDVMQIPLIGGRVFDDSARDRASTASLVISETLAHRMFPAAQAVGRQMWVGRREEPAEIIGIVADVKHGSLDEEAIPTVYVSAAQEPSRSSVIVVRSERPVRDAIGAVREEVARLDGNLPVYRIRTMTDVVDASPGLPSRRLLASAFTGLALLGVILSAIGLFGVAAHDVASRKPELTLRLALGADPTRILSATLRRGVTTVLIGLALGCLLSMWAVDALGSVIFSGGGVDAVSIATAAGVLMVVGVCAVLPAAVRAARTDPRLVLNGE